LRKQVARQLVQRFGKQPFHGMEEDVGLRHVIGQAQLRGRTVNGEPPLVDLKQLLGLGEEKLEVKLSGLDKFNGHAICLGAVSYTVAEKAVYRRREGRLRGRHGRRSREAPALFFLGGADEAIFPQNGPIRLCQLDAFVSEALDDMIKPRVLNKQKRKKPLANGWGLALRACDSVPRSYPRGNNTICPRTVLQGDIP